MSQAGTAPCLHGRVEVDGEHLGEVRFDTRARATLAKTIVVLDCRYLADLQVAGDQEQDVCPSSGQSTPDLGVLQAHSLGDGAGS